MHHHRPVPFNPAAVEATARIHHIITTAYGPSTNLSPTRGLQALAHLGPPRDPHRLPRL